MRRFFLFFLSVCMLFSCCFLLCGCEKESLSADTSKASSYTWQKRCYEPQADGATVIGSEPFLLDISHTDQGYMMARYTGTADKVNLQITGPDGTNYKYFMEPAEEYIPFTFTGGDGSYVIAAYENIGGDQYVSLFSEVVDIALKDEFLPFLYPNQYVFFTKDSQAVKEAENLCTAEKKDIDLLSDVYNYVISSISYDDEKARTVQLGYLPDIDETLETKKGICFDYAALMAAMLRSQGIPCKMAIGYSNEIKHAWIDVYIEGNGWIDRAIEFNGEEWKLMDPTFASNNEDEETVKDYIGDGENYTLQYNY